MTLFEANISTFLIDFFKANKKKFNTVENSNSFLESVCGIQSFFNNVAELSEFKDSIEEDISAFEEPNRRAYGDFQTNENLTDNIIQYLSQEGQSPAFLIEPTCGKGRFIISALKGFQSLKKVVGIEIYYPYIWEIKFRILELFLKKENSCKPQIEIVHEDIFNFDFETLAAENQTLNLLVIGNPPWVTNSELGTLDTKNLPKKSNFKNHKGIDAITGKGNFDIAEYITLQILKCFDKQEGNFAFLIKSSVVKNILYGQKKSNYKIGNIQKLNIDAKKEFNVSVDACLFLTRFNTSPEYTCSEINFYSKHFKTKFGWQKDKFVYSIAAYDKAKSIDGKCPFIWRQGMKHDCSKIMELDRFNGHYINGYKQEVNPEQNLLYGLLKSSDLKTEMVNIYRKTTIVTQKKIGQDTSYIKREYPLTYEYLNSNRAYFDRRKSSIYKGKPPFSIFGIGDYSFEKYKIAISGMYKRTTFSLVLPEKDKPLMLDDTCYFIGFDSLEKAQVVQKILNSEVVQNFLKAIIFLDAKRPITKDILMRIDLEKAYNLLQLEKNISEDVDWNVFESILQKAKTPSNQMTLF